jgi:hypothetical protein
MKKILYSVLFVLSALSSQAQFVVDSILDQSAALENLFLANGIFVNNISFTGDIAQFGTFTGGDAVNLGISSGIVMSNGHAQYVMIENPSSLAIVGSPSNNVDLNTLTGFSTYDLAQMDFDFVATGDSMTFQFVFGSQEYPEWVGSSYNDVFGFFVSGPGIAGTFSNGARNIALVPGTGDFVSINTINSTVNSSLYISNVIDTITKQNSGTMRPDG